MNNNKEVIKLLKIKKALLKRLRDDDESNKRNIQVKKLPVPSIKRR